MNFQLPAFLQQVAFNVSSTATTNGTGPTGTGAAGTPSFPAGVMDSFLATAGHASPLMQIVLFVYRMLGSQLGLDPSVLLTLLGFLWGFSKVGGQVYAHVADFVDRHFMCAMFVSEHDHIYNHLMKWLSQHKTIKDSQYLMAQTVWKSAWEEEEELENALYWTDGGDGDTDRKYLNFSNQAARCSPRYVPAMGATHFWYKGTFFRVYRKKESFLASSGWGTMKDLEEIRISCFGRSINPIKQLLSDAKHLYYDDTHQKTTIYRPKSKEMRRDHNMWQQVARRPVRPMRTVVLDSEEKHSVMSDVNEYLHPGTPRWYASRGIPLRRGYLFHGPPGTGKTSFSFALAGVFGIDIYVISLQDVNVTEEDLAILFTRLPRRCIVLLEDIDTAGLQRDNDSDEDTKQDAETEDEKQVNGDSEAVKEEDAAKKEVKVNGVAPKKTTERKKKRKSKKDDSSDESDSDSDSSDSDADERMAKHKKRGGRDPRGARSRTKDSSGKKISPLENISLSGLLNAIDGVASHEGRVLIMTTNKPETLDEALIRPGRVDVQVGFKNASSDQATELFYRMYETAVAPQSLHILDSKGSKGPDTEKAPSDLNKLMVAPGEDLDVTQEEIKAISEDFGRRIPEGMFSPAEIQGFLLKRKKDPRKALEEVESWVEGLKKQKEANSKVMTVQ